MTLPSGCSALDRRVLDEFREAGSGDAPDAFVNQIIDLYLVESVSLIGTVKEAIARHDGAAVARAVHSLKGSAGAIGATRIAGLSAELETLVRTGTVDGCAALLAALEDESTRVRRELLRERRILGN
jgi:HPt (histidine-containing phosphotransfer) domain-containing protein